MKEPSGQVVAKVSQEIDRDVPEDKLEQFRKGAIVFTAAFEVPAGRYTIEAAVMDPAGNRASTKRIALVTPKPNELALSSIAVVKEIDPLEGPRDPGNPMEFAGGRVLPSLTQSGWEGAPTALYFVVYPPTGTEKPKVTVTYLRDGVEVSRIQPEPGAIDELNSIPMITAAKLPVGDYVVRVMVEQAGRTENESVAVSIKPAPK